MTLPPVHTVRRTDTHRLLPAKYSANFESVLTRIADNTEHMETIFELDMATNQRLAAENHGTPGIDARELAFNIPYSHIINAAFTHPHPLGARFSTSLRGAWYAAFELATSKAEVLFHKSIEYAEIQWKERDEIEYDDYLADFHADFHDLRGSDLREGDLPESNLWDNPPETGNSTFAEYLSPTSYMASQQLAVQLLQVEALGVVYPSVRRRGGTCVACFRPAMVCNVRKGGRFRLTWTPNRGGRLVRKGLSAILDRVGQTGEEPIGKDALGDKFRRRTASLASSLAATGT